jgi:peptidoglycan/LPS O-acetylase OafA/YrhL
MSAYDLKSTSSLTAVWPERFEMLDAWRGVAAIAVVLHHLGPGHTFNLGHHAVLIFFVISGYCIAAAANSCMRKELGFSSYMWRRIRRIYPPYFLALLFFLGTRIVKYVHGGGWQFPATWASWIQNFTLTQWLTLLLNPKSWAAQNPTLTVAAFWSLNYEEQFYVVVGLLMLAIGYFRFSLLAIVPILFGFAFAWNVCFPTICYGFFIEYWILFGLGCLVFFRLCRIQNRRLRMLIDFGLVVLIIVSAYVAWFAELGWDENLRLVYREWTVGSVFAFMLILFRPLSTSFACWLPGRTLMMMGAITYSLYLTHQFNLTLAETVSRRLLGPQAPLFCHIFIQVAFLIALASVFWYFCERPFLNKGLEAKNKGHVVPDKLTMCLRS